MDFICGRFLLWAFLEFPVLVVLLFTSLLLDDRDFWLAFGLPVVFPFGSAGLRLLIRLWIFSCRGY